MHAACTPICGANLTKFIQVYLNGSGNQYYSPHQSEAMESIHYWYDGNVPYYTDVTAWQPLDDNFVHVNVPVYAYVDNSNGTTTHQVWHNLQTCQSHVLGLTLCWCHTQLVNIRQSHGHVCYQESLHHSYSPQHWEPSYAHNCTYHQFSAPPSPCTSIASHCTSTFSSLHGWDGPVRSPPAQHRRQQHSHSHSHSDDVVPGLQLVTPYSPPPVSSSPAPAPELRTTTTTPPQEDLVGRLASVSSAPKRRRVTRAVQPLACFFCRGRKIACGPPTSTPSGDRTCEYVVMRQLTLPKKKKTLFS